MVNSHLSFALHVLEILHFTLLMTCNYYVSTGRKTEQNRTDYLFDVNYTASSQSNTIIIIYISRSQILLKCLNQVVVLI